MIKLNYHLRCCNLYLKETYINSWNKTFETYGVICIYYAHVVQIIFVREVICILRTYKIIEIMALFYTENREDTITATSTCLLNNQVLTRIMQLNSNPISTICSNNVVFNQLWSCYYVPIF